MILGFSHVSLGTNSISRSYDELSKFGYKALFKYNTLLNHPKKKRFLHSYQKYHDISYLSAFRGGLSVELIDHGSLYPLQSPYLIPVACSPHPANNWILCDNKLLPFDIDDLVPFRSTLDTPLRLYYNPELNLKFFWYSSFHKTGFCAFVVACKQLPDFCSLLNQMRFRSNGNNVYSLLTPIASMQCTLIPVNYSKNENWCDLPYLDTAGCSSIAFMTRQTSTFVADTFGRYDSVAFDLQLQKLTRITLVGPTSGPILELIEPLQ